MATLKASAADYYDRNPSLEHVPGDIWSGLPTFGLLPDVCCHGLVITPACDLANNKVETVTYLPIVPVSSYLQMAGFRPELVRAINGQLELAGIPPASRLPKAFIPEPQQISQAEAAISLRQQAGLGKTESEALTRASHGLGILNCATFGDPKQVMKSLTTLFGGKELDRILGKVVKNSHIDLHFLPADGQKREWSGVHSHSVALLRYAVSIPAVILDDAQDIQIADWPARMRLLQPKVPAAAMCMSEKPLKRSALRGRFLSDLLTRYVALFVRLGSPDFSNDTIGTFVTDLRSE